MSDDLDELKAALSAATPAPDAAKKAADIALARKNFAELQESRSGARHTSERPKTGFFRGVKNMIAGLNMRGALAASTALVALGLVVVLPLGELGPRFYGGSDWQTIERETQVSERESVLPELEERVPSLRSESLAVDEFVTAEQAGTAQSVLQGGGLYSTNNEAAKRSLSDRSRMSGQLAAEPLILAPAPDQVVILPESNTETFPDADANPLKVTAEEPVSTFSIDVDTASYAVVRSSLTAGQLPPKEAVRVEEMVNYFTYDYAAPEAGGAPFRPTVSVTDTPWNSNTQLVHIAIQGEKPAIEDRPPLNLVFLIDTSGSMNAPNKLPLLKLSLSLMLPQLTDQDQVAIVTYAGSAGQVLEPTQATERETILAALDRLHAGGGTAGQAGLQQAYAVADGMAEDGEVTRVILATDGDFNVGLSDPEALKDFIEDKRETGTYLSVMGFGRGNLDDATMQALAQNGNGQASYIDTLSEAQKVMVDQVSGALFPIANDVKIQVEFNPAQIAEYRLIGYETRTLRREDFNNDRVDAGDIGAGHQITALYEVTPVGSPARQTDPLRYGEQTVVSTEGELGFLKLRYKKPGAETSELIEMPIVEDGPLGSDARFATAMAGFAQLLRGETYLGEWSYAEAITLANAARGEDPFGYRAEAVQLMRLAQSLKR
ncbi:MAG: von Willebrand factor type A domain-containing protein [Pseudomonadota bacterium]